MNPSELEAIQGVIKVRVIKKRLLMKAVKRTAAAVLFC